MVTDEEYRQLLSNGREIFNAEIRDVSRRFDMTTADGKRALISFCCGVLNSAASAVVAAGMDPSESRKIAICATKLGATAGLTCWDDETILKHIEEFSE